jgi:hypothetical protein
MTALRSRVPDVFGFAGSKTTRPTTGLEPEHDEVEGREEAKENGEWVVIQSFPPKGNSVDKRSELGLKLVEYLWRLNGWDVDLKENEKGTEEDFKGGKEQVRE